MSCCIGFQGGSGGRKVLAYLFPWICTYIYQQLLMHDISPWLCL